MASLGSGGRAQLQLALAQRIVHSAMSQAPNTDFIVPEILFDLTRALRYVGRGTMNLFRPLV